MTVVLPFSGSRETPRPAARSRSRLALLRRLWRRVQARRRLASLLAFRDARMQLDVGLRPQPRHYALFHLLYR